jgi:hypothetical protein
LDTDAAFVDVEQTVTAPDGNEILAVHLAALFRREGNGWRFVDARPYAYPALPAPV